MGNFTFHRIQTWSIIIDHTPYSTTCIPFFLFLFFQIKKGSNFGYVRWTGRDGLVALLKIHCVMCIMYKSVCVTHCADEQTGDAVSFREISLYFSYSFSCSLFLGRVISEENIHLKMLFRIRFSLSIHSINESEPRDKMLSSNELNTFVSVSFHLNIDEI